jgi:hypothetical protein
MSPQLDQIFQDLSQLTLPERWQVVEYLIGQFKDNIVVSPQVSDNAQISAQEIFTVTQGKWGDRTIAEIDGQLASQRQFDWGE